METALSISTVLGLDAEGVLAKKYNLWIGVSNSAWFNHTDNLECIIRWAKGHTRNRLLVLVAGRLYAVNVNHIEKKSRARALREGYEIERRFRARVEALPFINDRPKIRIVDYDEVMTSAHVMRRSALFREFSKEEAFYERVTEIAADFLKARGRTVEKSRVEAAALYQLQELPLFIAPIRPIGADENEYYEANVYPGLGRFDELARDLVEGGVFPELTKELKLTEPCGVVSVTRKENA